MSTELMQFEAGIRKMAALIDELERRPEQMRLFSAGVLQGCLLHTGQLMAIEGWPLPVAAAIARVELAIVLSIVAAMQRDQDAAG